MCCVMFSKSLGMYLKLKQVRKGSLLRDELFLYISIGTGEIETDIGKLSDSRDLQCQQITRSRQHKHRSKQ